ncbi:hypothetical protein Tco_0896399 [Tanacetum coccineum]
MKKRKTSKDAKPTKGSKSKESKTSSSKVTKSQPKSSEKSAQAEELVFEAANTIIAKAAKPPLTFYEVINTPIDFSAYVILSLKIDYLTQQHLVGPAFNLLKGTCNNRVELEFHFEECYKAVNDRLDWTNPKGHQYPFDLSKPLPLIEVQGRQVVPADYFINNDHEYLKDGSLSRKYTTFTTKNKAAKYDNIQGNEDMVSMLVSKHDVYSRKRIIAITHVKVMKWYDYGYLEKIVVRREDQMFHKFKEGDFPNLNLRDIKDMMLFLVQKKILNLEKMLSST